MGNDYEIQFGVSFVYLIVDLWLTYILSHSLQLP